MPREPREEYRDPLLKRIELWMRRKLIEGFGTPVNPVRVERPQLVLDLPEHPKILFLRQDKIGDALVSFPVIRVLRQEFPNATIDILLGDANYAIRSALARYIRKAWCYSKSIAKTLRLLSLLRAERYDVVIDLMDNSSATSSFLVKNIRSRYAVGIDKENAAVYSHLVPLPDRQSVHIVERIAYLLLPFGIDPSQHDLSLEYPFSPEDIALARERLGPNTHSLRLGVNISGTGEQKYWGRQRFTELIDALLAAHDDVQVVVFSSPEYEAERSAIVQATGAVEGARANNFHEFAAMLHECDVIFTPDTSVVHLAGAWKMPCVGLFINTKLNLMPWTPYGAPHEALITNKQHVSFIPVADAIEGVERMLAVAAGRGAEGGTTRSVFCDR